MVRKEVWEPGLGSLCPGLDGHSYESPFFKIWIRRYLLGTRLSVSLVRLLHIFIGSNTPYEYGEYSRYSDLGLQVRGSMPGRSNVFLLSTTSRPAVGSTQPHPLTMWVPEGSLRKVKRSGRETNYSPPPNTDVKNGEVIPPLHHTS
jgi:hypothetical protein